MANARDVRVGPPTCGIGVVPKKSNRCTSSVTSLQKWIGSIFTPFVKRRQLNAAYAVVVLRNWGRRRRADLTRQALSIHCVGHERRLHYPGSRQQDWSDEPSI